VQREGNVNDLETDEASRQDDLRYVINEYMSHYMAERFHEVLGGQLVVVISDGDTPWPLGVRCNDAIHRNQVRRAFTPAEKLAATPATPVRQPATCNGRPTSTTGN
jgi:hypothetical protein